MIGDNTERTAKAQRSQHSAATAANGTTPSQALPADPSTAQAVASPGHGRVVAQQSLTMAVGSMLGRATGLIRTIVLGAAIGGALLNNDYTLANNLPNMVYELLLGGVLAATVVPVLVRARLDSDDNGVAYAQRLLSAATVFLGLATVLAVACAPLLTHVIATGADGADRRVVTILSYLLLPEILFYGIAALLGAVLNTRGQFAAPMWAPILNNIVVIVTAAAFLLLPTITQPPTPSNVSTAQLLVLGVGSTLGIVAQAVGLLPALRRGGFAWRWRFDWRFLNGLELARLSTWTLVYVVVNQIAVVVVLNIANHARQPGPAIYNNAFLMVMMVYGIVAVSITTALMPRMAGAAHARRNEDLVRLITLGMRLSLVILVPATITFLVMGRQIGVSLFEFGSFTHDEAIQTGLVIAVGGLVLIPFSLNQLQIFAFYAMSNTRTPALANIPVAATRIGFDLLAFWVLPHKWVAAALMAGNAVSFMFGMFIEGRLLRKRLGALPIAGVVSTAWRVAAAGLAAAVVTVGVLAVLQYMLGLGKFASLLEAAIGLTVLTVVYLGVGHWLRTPELRQLNVMVRERFRSSAPEPGSQ
jgi:putative peptidoglycan lipid II flippase